MLKLSQRVLAGAAVTALVAGAAATVESVDAAATAATAAPTASIHHAASHVVARKRRHRLRAAARVKKDSWKAPTLTLVSATCTADTERSQPGAPAYFVTATWKLTGGIFSFVPFTGKIREINSPSKSVTFTTQQDDANPDPSSEYLYVSQDVSKFKDPWGWSKTYTKTVPFYAGTCKVV